MGCNKGCNSNNNKTLVFLERVCYNITIDNDGGTIMSEKKKRGQGEWSFSQRKDGLWTARKQFGKKDNGKPNIIAFYGKNLTDVRKKAKEYEAGLACNRGQVIAKDTVYSYVKRYITTYKIHSVKQTTYDVLEDTCEIRLKPFSLAMVPLNNVTTEKCQEYINELTACDKKYSLATIAKAYNLINSCFNYAVGVGDLQKNPMEYVKLPSADKVQTQTKDITIFNFEEVELIYNECLRTYRNGTPVYQYGDLIILMLYSGIRIGECIGLTWEDVDFDKNEIYINNTIAVVKNRDENGKTKYTLTNTSTKTKKSNRTVQLSKRAKMALLRIKAKHKSAMPSDFVSTSKTGQIANVRNVSRCLNTILKNAGIDNPDNYSPHSLRHTFVSMLLAKGVDIKIISELIGHEKVSTTYNIYAHLMPNQKEEAIKALDKLDS